jgi:hypothetical protein
MEQSNYELVEKEVLKGFKEVNDPYVKGYSNFISEHGQDFSKEDLIEIIKSLDLSLFAYSKETNYNQVIHESVLVLKSQVNVANG